MSSLTSSSSNPESSGSASPKKRRKTSSAGGEIDFAKVAAVASKQSAARLKQLPNADFRVTVLQHQLSQMIYTLDGTLTEAVLIISNTSSFTGIRCDAMSPDLTCMIKGKVAAEVDMAGQKESIRINLRDIKPAMKATQGSTSLDLVRYTGDDFITIEGTQMVPFRRFTMHTLVNEEQDLPIFDIDTKFTIDIQCSHLKDFARRSTDFNCETVRMRVLKTTQGNTQHHFFELANHGDGLKKASFLYHSVSQLRNDSAAEIVCDTSVTDDEVFALALRATEVYSAEFQSSYITDFLKVFDRGSIHLNLASDEDGPGPLILHASLGNSNSFMRLLLSPKETLEEA